MSSKQSQHITRANYEEFFLLYVDGELSPEAMDNVDAFASLHPDLREELDLLLETRLDAPEVSFGDTSMLLSSQMRLAADEEELLNHLDGELPAAAAARMNERLQHEPLLRAEWMALQAAKLDPAETIVFPDKESLYRRERERRPFIWWQVAAAVLLFGGGVALWSVGNRTDNGGGPVASGGGKTEVVAPKGTTVPKTNGVNTAVNPGNDITAASDKDRDALAANTTASSSATAQKTSKAINSGKIVSKDAPAPMIAQAPDQRDRVQDGDEDNDAVATLDVPLTRRIATGTDANTPSQNIGDAPVTKPLTLTYTSLNTATNPAPVAAVVRDEKPQGSFRGLLRKAARFVEKRTGIKATNENDQLVVGAVAINLK